MVPERHANGLAAGEDRLDDRRDPGAPVARGALEHERVPDLDLRPRRRSPRPTETSRARSARRTPLARRRPPASSSVVSTAVVLGSGRRRTAVPMAAFALSASRGSSGTETKPLGSDHRRPRGSARSASRDPFAIVCCGPCPGRSPRGCTVRSRAKLWSNSSSIEFRKLAPRLLIPTTSARPIISAVAVAAVRLGFERAESAARRPSTGASFRTGQESTPGQRARSGTARSARSRRRSRSCRRSRPRPQRWWSRRRRRAGRRPASPGRISSDRRRRRAGPRAVADALGAEHGPDRRDPARPARRVERPEHARSAARSRPPRSAAIGVSSSSPTGKLDAARISSIRPSASSTPRPSPSTAPDHPEDRRLEQDRADDHRPGGAERALHADLAHPLEHGHVEAVEDQEAADEQRHPGEEVEDDVERLELAAGSPRPSPAASRPRPPSRTPPRGVAGPRRSRPRPRPRRSPRPRRRRRACRRRGARSRSGIVAEPLAAEVEAVREPEEADHLERRSTPPGAARRIGLPDLDPVRLGPALLDLDLAAARDLAARR